MELENMFVPKSVQNAEMYAKKKHAGQFRKDGITLYAKHLEDVVNRLKSLGVVKSELLCAGWLHDTLEDTETNFDDLYEKFDSAVAVLVSSITKEMSLPRKKREQEYIRHLQESSADAKLIKFCDISANLSDLKNYEASKSKKLRQIRQKRHYLNVIKNDLPISKYPNILTLLDSVNRIFKKYGQRSVLIKQD